MSKQVFTQVIRGAHAWVRQAEEALDKAMAEHGPDKPVDTNDTPEGRARNRRVELRRT
mgnify:CR=1 FL=1